MRDHILRSFLKVIIHSEITKELNLTGNPRKWTYVYI
jgi:hypothetical protein